MSFDPRPLIKEIARGRHSARDLTHEQAHALFSAILSGEVQGAALGAVLVALRVKGESVVELAGMMDAVAAHVRPLELPARRPATLMIPSYNGARKLPNLVPLLALLLARERVPVLLHGAAQEAQRVGSFEILALLGHAASASIDDAQARLERDSIAAVPIAVLAPDLARLIDLRLELGVRNSGHTLAKLLLPRGAEAENACRLVAVTHPDFMELLRQHFATAPANVFLMRGVEGEPVVRLRSPQPIEHIGLDRRLVTHLIGDGDAEVDLPGRDAESTARWTEAILAGRRPVPTAIARQVALLAGHCRAAPGNAPRQALRLVASNPPRPGLSSA